MTATMHTTNRPKAPLRASLLALGFLAAACGSTRRNEPYVEDLSVLDETTREALGDVAGRQADPNLQRRLATMIVDSSEAGGLKSYRLELRNTSDEPADVSWTVDWFDRRGQRIAPARRTWNRAQLKAGESTPIEITAPSRAADSWRLVPVDTNTLQR
jgi:uncharacterized protein YcfL